MIFKQEKIRLIKKWGKTCIPPIDYEYIDGDSNYNIDSEFDYWTEEEHFTHNQITSKSLDLK